jgi:hypothetical protein
MQSSIAAVLLPASLMLSHPIPFVKLTERKRKPGRRLIGVRLNMTARYTKRSEQLGDTAERLAY